MEREAETGVAGLTPRRRREQIHMPPVTEPYPALLAAPKVAQYVLYIQTTYMASKRRAFVDVHILRAVSRTAGA